MALLYQCFIDFLQRVFHNTNIFQSRVHGYTCTVRGLSISACWDRRQGRFTRIKNGQPHTNSTDFINMQFHLCGRMKIHKRINKSLHLWLKHIADRMARIPNKRTTRCKEHYTPKKNNQNNITVHKISMNMKTMFCKRINIRIPLIEINTILNHIKKQKLLFPHIYTSIT